METEKDPPMRGDGNHRSGGPCRVASIKRYFGNPWVIIEIEIEMRAQIRSQQSVEVI